MLTLIEKIKEQPQSGGPSGDMAALQTSIAGLADKISNMSFSGGGGGQIGVIDKEIVLERLFARDDKTDMESNVSNVKVKEAKASSGVTNTLNKLKALQQGGNKDGD